MMDITDYQFNGIPILIYGMIGLTTLVLTYATLLDTGENPASSTPTAEPEPEPEPQQEPEPEPSPEPDSSSPATGGGIRKPRHGTRHKKSPPSKKHANKTHKHKMHSKK